MILGARTAMWGGGKKTPTAADYVQDGLVAMWDGIENAGWGVHDANATVWKDLVGNYDMTINDLSIASFSDKAFRYRSDINSASTSGFISNASFFDIVIKAEKANTQFVACALCDTYNAIIYRNNNRGVSLTARPIGCAITINANDGVFHLLSVDYSGTYSTSAKPPVYLDGVDVGDYGVSGSWWSDFSMPSTIKLGGIFRGNYGYTQICRIAAYSRALTSSEIAANYAIDKERFGLT